MVAGRAISSRSSKRSSTRRCRARCRVVLRIRSATGRVRALSRTCRRRCRCTRRRCRRDGGDRRIQRQLVRGRPGIWFIGLQKIAGVSHAVAQSDGGMRRWQLFVFHSRKRGINPSCSVPINSCRMQPRKRRHTNSSPAPCPSPIRSRQNIAFVDHTADVVALSGQWERRRGDVGPRHRIGAAKSSIILLRARRLLHVLYLWARRYVDRSFWTLSFCSHGRWSRKIRQSAAGRCAQQRHPHSRGGTVSGRICDRVGRAGDSGRAGHGHATDRK